MTTTLQLLKFHGGHSFVICRCGWSLRAAGSNGIIAWFDATVRKHMAACQA